MSSANPALRDPLPSYGDIGLPIVWLFCGFVIYKYLQVGERLPMLGALRVELLYGLLLGLLAVAAKPRWRHPVTAWVLAFLVCASASLLWSSDPTTSNTVFIDKVIKYAALGLFIAAFAAGPRGLGWFLAAFLAAFMKIGQEGVVGVVTGELMWENQGVPRLHGSTPLYAHPNSLAGTMLATLPFVYYLFPIVSWPLRVLLLLQAAFVANAVVFSGSRTAYLGAVAIVLVVVWRSKQRLRALIGLGLLAALLLPLIPSDYYRRFETIFTGQEIEGGSIDARQQIISDAVEVFARYPFGVGVGAFPAVRSALFGRGQDTHNLYLEVGTNLGVQGLLVFLGWLGAMLIGLERLRRRFTADGERLRQLLTTAALPAARRDLANQHLRHLSFFAAVAQATHLFLITRAVLGLFGHDLYEVYWWFAAGLTVALATIADVATRRTSGLEREARG